jgi:hypothetical protein
MEIDNEKQHDLDGEAIPQNIITESLDSNKNIPFWSENPNVLLNPDYLLEFFPVESMTYEQKLNAITRSIIVLSIFGFIFTKNTRLIVIAIITITAVFFLYSFQKAKDQKMKQNNLNNDIEEGFANPADEILKKYNYTKNPEVFDKPTSENPFSNILITDYEYNPDKKPAPPAFNHSVNNNILEQAKKLVSEMNPGQPDISDKLFKDLGEQYVFEQSLRKFNSNPATTIPNDQKGFAEFCYGSMVSSHDGNPFALARNLPRHNNY